MGRAAGEAVRLSEVDPPAGAGRERRQGRDHLLRELVHPAAAPAERPAYPLSRRQPRLAIPISQAVHPARFPVPVRRGSAMKLYHSASSPNSRRVRIFLAEKGLSIPLVAVDLGKGEQHSDAYRAINPRRVVPTLVLEDGTAIGEVPAISRYIEETHPTPPFLAYTPKEKALLTMCEPP